MQRSFVTLWAVDIDFPLCRTVGTFLWSKPSSTQILTCNFEISLTDSGMELKAPSVCFLPIRGFGHGIKSPISDRKIRFFLLVFCSVKPGFSPQNQV